MGTTSRQGARRGERGVVLAIALFAMVTLSVVLATSLMIGSSDILATRNYRQATQTHFAAESAVSEALQRMNTIGVVNFQQDVVNHWGSVWGAATHGFAPLSGFSYTATVVATPGNTANAGRIVAVASGPEGAASTVVATVARSDIPSTTPGALYLAPDSPTNSAFNGNAFTIDGNDRNYTGGAGPGSPVPGISTRNDANTQEAINSLNDSQRHDVTGMGYSAGPPTVPSVKTAWAAPTVDQVNQIVLDLLALPGVVDYGDSQINGTATFGTSAAPQITHFTASGGVTIKGNGNASGAGIIIVDGDLTIEGNLDFKGLILVRGRTSVAGDTEFTGHASIYGGVWTNDVNLVVGGSAVIQYSTQALALANAVTGGAPGGALPSPMMISALADCAQLPAGAGGCP